MNQLGITTTTGEAEVLLFFRPENHQRRIHELKIETRCDRWESSNNPPTHLLFEIQAEKKPNDIAVVFNDQKLTYEELNARANRLAHFLQALGVGPDVYVGIYLERSMDIVIGLLAVLKAGGAYVPLNPKYPRKPGLLAWRETAWTGLARYSGSCST